MPKSTMNIITDRPEEVPPVLENNGYPIRIFSRLIDFLNGQSWLRESAILIMDARCNGESVVRHAVEVTSRLRPAYPILLWVRDTKRNRDLSNMEDILLEAHGDQMLKSLRMAERKGNEFSLGDMSRLLLLNHSAIGLER